MRFLPKPAGQALSRCGAARELRLEDELVRAINQGQLELFYQPLFRIDNRHITGFEALTRWNHPDRGIVGPDNFLAIAAQLGLMPTIDAPS